MDKRLTEAIKKQTAHSHFCAFYDSDAERLRLLASYYKLGLEQHELCVFVTHQKPSVLIKQLKSYGLDIEEAVRKGDFQIFPTQATYLPDGKFRYPQMLDNIESFVKRAAQLKYTGVRGGGDMDWLAKNVADRNDLGRYEAKVNRFIKHNNFSGLCLFPAKLLDLEFTKTVIQTHPEIARHDLLYPNPYYIPPEQFLAQTKHLQNQMENWIDIVDQQENNKQTPELKEAGGVIADLLPAN